MVGGERKTGKAGDGHEEEIPILSKLGKEAGGQTGRIRDRKVVACTVDRIIFGCSR